MPKRIKKPKIKPNPEKVRFCFECLQMDHARFKASECTTEFFMALFVEIKRYEEWTLDQFRKEEENDKRHQHRGFSDTSEPHGFDSIDPSGDTFWTDEAWQFALRDSRGIVSRNWRVHGFIDRDVFYIVWLDPHHRLNSK